VIGIIGENGSGKSSLPAAGRRFGDAGIGTGGSFRRRLPAGTGRSARSGRAGKSRIAGFSPSTTRLPVMTCWCGSAPPSGSTFSAAGVTTLLVSHEEDLLQRLADEIWWLRGGRLAAARPRPRCCGPIEGRSSARCAPGGNDEPALAPRMRRGDGRAEVVRIETLGEEGRPTMIWRSGELAVVRATVRFHKDVADP